ncbi:DNA polymerase III subunit chi, partial [Pseudomonas aeruginosa]|nr:DNA polymerase III subunit chi [Pseudomonas aeruginosa]
QERLDDELRASAELILQEVIDDFAPQIEAELRRRLQARLGRLLGQRNG